MYDNIYLAGWTMFVIHSLRALFLTFSFEVEENLEQLAATF